jgi:Protein of unknown function (DUF4199)
MNRTLHSLQYALVAVFSAIIIGLATFLILKHTQSPLNYLSYAIYILLAILGLKKWRNEMNAGFLSFGASMGYLSLMMFFYSVIIMIWTYIFLEYIAHDEMLALMDQQMALAEEQLREKKISENIIEAQLNIARTFQKPGIIALFALLGNAFILTITNLIIAAIMKKDNDTFSGQPQAQF